MKVVKVGKTLFKDLEGKLKYKPRGISHYGLRRKQNSMRDRAIKAFMTGIDLNNVLIKSELQKRLDPVISLYKGPKAKTGVRFHVVKSKITKSRIPLATVTPRSKIFLSIANIYRRIKDYLHTKSMRRKAITAFYATDKRNAS